MTNTWETDNCAAMRANYAVYSIPQAAALWCGVPENQVEQIVDEATQLSTTGFGRSVWRHPKVPCLEARSRAIAEACEKRELPHGRDDGEPVREDDCVAYERRTFSGRNLKEWMEKAFPNEKPAFLFDDIEQSTHTAISADAYRALKAEHDKLEKRLENAKIEFKKLRDEKDAIESERDSLKAMVDKMGAPGERAESTYHNIIAALLEVIEEGIPSLETSIDRIGPAAEFESVAKLISAIAHHYRGIDGLSKSNLERKFPAAKRTLNASY